METTTRNIPQISKRARLTLTLAGIITAIICSLILVNETHATGSVARRITRLAESPRIVTGNYSVALKNIDVARVVQVGLAHP